eukprot:360299-Chlamydomonas_euryale.AAC.9
MPEALHMRRSEEGHRTKYGGQARLSAGGSGTCMKQQSHDWCPCRGVTMGTRTGYTPGLIHTCRRAGSTWWCLRGTPPPPSTPPLETGNKID